MSTTAASAPQLRPGAPVHAAHAVITAIAALALAGTVLAARALVVGGHHPVAVVVRQAPGDGAWRSATSFGDVRVERIERFAAAAPGRTHDGHVTTADELRLSVTLTNRLRAAVPFSAGQFRLRPASTRTTVAPVRATPRPGGLAPGAARERIAFRVDGRDDAYSLVFDDLARARPVRIDVGSVPGGR